MGSALLEGVVRSGFCEPGDIVVHDAWQPAIDECVERNGVTAAKSNAEVVENSEIFVLCVKPQHVVPTLKELRDGPKDRLLVSIAAGVPIWRIEQTLENRHRVVRVMPNTPALVGKGASAYALGFHATPKDGVAVKQILDSVGLSCEVSEAQLDAVTGLSGSGPAYVFTIIEALADGGVLEGLPRPLALELAAQTVLGAAELVRQSDEHPAKLRDNVASPGGTTIAGIAVLEKLGLRSALIEAVRAATRRSREMGKS